MTCSHTLETFRARFAVADVETVRVAEDQVLGSFRVGDELLSEWRGGEIENVAGASSVAPGPHLLVCFQGGRAEHGRGERILRELPDD